MAVQSADVWVTPAEGVPKRKRVLVVAGEASGDVHGAGVVEALRRHIAELEVFGIGGSHMRQAGVRIAIDTAEVATMGLWESADRLRHVVGAYRRVKKIMREERPDIVLLIDFPEFNLRLARAAKRTGIRVLYYISPQVWAWRRRRVQALATRADKLAVVFPFEASLFQGMGARVEFVGHPLVDRVHPTRSRAETLARYSLDPARKTVLLMPGSRRSEVRYLCPPLLEAARILGRDGECQFILSVAPTLEEGELRERVKDAKAEVRVVQGDTYDLIHGADLVLVASGTATLETALLGRPMVIVYRLSPLTYLLARLMVRVPSIGMPNIIAGKKIVPELVQGEATGDRIAAVARQILSTPAVREDMVRALGEVCRRLGSGGAAEKVAAMAAEMLR